MASVEEHIETNKDRFLNELLDLLRIPSVSADPKYKADVARCAEKVKTRMEEAGLEKVEVCPTKGHPIVYGEKIIDPAKPTVLVYGHYDVQPPDPLDLWDSPPFEPVVKDGVIYARGSADDKGQFYMHVKAVEAMVKTGNLPCNVKMMIEGEEEVGSSNLGTFVKENKEKLAADVVLISDTSMIANDVPSINTGLRGLAYLEVEVVGPNRDLHSGVYGGAVANPIHVLCEMIASLHDEDQRINIPGFYEAVQELSDAERKELAKAPFDEKEYMNELGVKAVRGEKGYTTAERCTIRPTLDVNGIWGGYIGEGAKTVLASKASAKISMRLVPNQKSAAITKLFSDHFKKIAPPYVTVTVNPHHGGEAAVTPTDSIAYKAASKAMEEAFGKKPIPTRGGGSIPIVALFEEELGLKTILFGFGLDSDNIHSPNEHYGVFNYMKGITTIPKFYRNFAEMSK
ncbi:MAG TPA: dipeptidase [Flavobacteriales bacterium]|nr:dipeptidase [Flavobacteriales bacterium]MBK7248916.1 dipeptidase [Flavobacteriales bacterium]QQS71170.1 MAG: dipeptidase [Flavobacteriales bacterium]HQV38697.1 dipeptidase [Flavobacteriales bacterium]HQW32092.1 dipeptidase [Flavobacteriales bacterium]